MAAEAEAELRTRVRSWASPPATRGWPARCGRRPCQTGPWGRRRSACRPQTGSRRARTGPRWKAGGSGGGTRGRCSRGHPGGPGEGAVRDAAATGGGGLAQRRPSWTARGSDPRYPHGAVAGPCAGPWDRPASLHTVWACLGPLALHNNVTLTSCEWSCPWPCPWVQLSLHLWPHRLLGLRSLPSI